MILPVPRIPPLACKFCHVLWNGRTDWRPYNRMTFDWPCLFIASDWYVTSRTLSLCYCFYQTKSLWIQLGRRVLEITGRGTSLFTDQPALIDIILRTASQWSWIWLYLRSCLCFVGYMHTRIHGHTVATIACALNMALHCGKIWLREGRPRSSSSKLMREILHYSHIEWAASPVTFSRQRVPKALRTRYWPTSDGRVASRKTKRFWQHSQ